MSNPILIIDNAGHGKTPECPEAKFKIGDVVRRRNLKHLSHLPEQAVIALIVPPGFPPEYAWADMKKEPRPLMVSKGRRIVQYIVGFEGDRQPHLMTEKSFFPEPVGTGEITWESE